MSNTMHANKKRNKAKAKITKNSRKKKEEEAITVRKKIITTCKRCCGSGLVSHAENKIICPECEGHGHFRKKQKDGKGEKDVR